MNSSLLLKEIVDRRSIRKYKNQIVEPEKIALLLEAARLAPSACNLQPFRALVVDKPEELAFVSQTAYGIGATTNAPLIIIGMADITADTKLQDRFEELLEAKSIEPVDMGKLKSAKNAPFQLKLGEDIALLSTAIAIEHIVLQAAKLELGTCWVHHFEIDEIRDYFKIPENMRIVTLLTVGYPNETPKQRPRLKDIRWER
ncbi:MAG: nitroreductase family protein [Flavobacterium sp.]|nr:nitroreductase family protein [Flavobacterium sp.]